LIVLPRCGSAEFAGNNNRAARQNSPANVSPIELPNSGAIADSCNKHLAVSLVLDVSGSMNNEKIAAVRESANILISSLNPTDFSALTVFNTEGKAIAPMSTNHAATMGTLSADATAMPGGNTDINAGLEAGTKEFTQKVGGSETMKILILLSDGEHNTGESPIPLAQEIKQSGDITIFSIVGVRDMSFLNGLLGQDPAISQMIDMFSGQGKTTMAQISSGPEYYLEAKDKVNLQQAFKTIRQSLCRAP
jgi:uncharacterized protein YegL